MGCATHKLPKQLFNKADLIELQKYSDELHEKRIKILKWMEDDLELKSPMNDYKKINWKNIKENEQLTYWQEAWEREQELVKHPSMVDSCESKISCITMIDENLRVLCDEEVETFWKDFEQTHLPN
ncbi:unnamed protein product [Adineta steineri]|uniref:Uncharacterized protein n=1 Tax=Adineta steineri TaxID=433720 RepID=A0A815HN38_9BILA|nr:unnamed protein product [Adineta steineri]CAF3912144.1 unnamed protein product [Adineta steineri]